MPRPRSRTCDSPYGRPGEGFNVNLMIGILALGRGFTSKFVSLSSKSPIMATRSDAWRAASLLSIRQTRSMSGERAKRSQFGAGSPILDRKG